MKFLFLDINKDIILKKIKELNWVCKKDNVLMKRVIFQKFNEKNKSYCRVRDEWDKIMTTYKEIKDWKLDINSVKEINCVVWDFDDMVEIFKKSWLEQISYEESYREIWEINNEIEICIDLWPWLKPYIEIEWESEDVVKKYSQLLWFDFQKWTFGSVFDIYWIELWISYDKLMSFRWNNFWKSTKEKCQIIHI